MSEHKEQLQDVVICWSCGLPIPMVNSPVGKMADPKHNCIVALKEEVWKLRSKLADAWG